MKIKMVGDEFCQLFTHQNIGCGFIVKERDGNLIKDIDFSFKLGKDYDGTKSEAKFNNGVLSIIIDKKDERKAKKLSINIR
jgi:hypothetical protein